MFYLVVFLICTPFICCIVAYFLLRNKVDESIRPTLEVFVGFSAILLILCLGLAILIVAMALLMTPGPSVEYKYLNQELKELKSKESEDSKKRIEEIEKKKTEIRKNAEGKQAFFFFSPELKDE